MDKVPVSDLCEEAGLRPAMFYRWQEDFFENGAAAFQGCINEHNGWVPRDFLTGAEPLVGGNSYLPFSDLLVVDIECDLATRDRLLARN